MEYRSVYPTPTNRGATPSIKDIEAEAAGFARQNAGAVTRNLYAPGESKMTKERAFAQALEANPEVWERFRAQHNVAPTIAALEAAGYELKRSR